MPRKQKGYRFSAALLICLAQRLGPVKPLITQMECVLYNPGQLEGEKGQSQIKLRGVKCREKKNKLRWRKQVPTDIYSIFSHTFFSHCVISS